jgi:hypothetical protein
MQLKLAKQGTVTSSAVRSSKKQQESNVDYKMQSCRRLSLEKKAVKK